MIESLKRHDKAVALLEEGIPEQSLYWIDPVTKQRCKSRPDYLRSSSHILDLKSIRKGLGNNRDFSREIWNREYYIQGAMQFDGCTHVLGGEQHSVTYIVVETSEPWSCFVHVLDPASLERGSARYKDALHYHYWCVQNNRWEGPQFNRHELTYLAENIGLPVWTDNL